MKARGLERSAGPPLQRVSLADIRRRLAAFRRLDLGELDQEQVHQRVGLIIDDFPLMIDPLALNGVYRGRPNEAGQIFSKASELWYPPAEKARTGRFNMAREAVFYCGNTVNTAMFEIGARPGDTCTVLLARSNVEFVSLRTAFIGASVSNSFDVDQGFAGSREQMLRNKLGPGRFNKYRMIDGWLTEMVTRPVSRDQTELYKGTIAFGQLLRGSGIDALAYPSVATKHDGINLCMSPESADRFFRADEAWMFEFGDYYTHPEFKEPEMIVKPVRRSHPIGPDGSITWRVDGDGLGAFPLLARRHIKTISTMPERVPPTP